MWLACVLGIAAGIACGALRKDPRLGFLERRGELAGAELQERLETSDRFVERWNLRSTSGLSVDVAIARPRELAPVRRPTLLLLGGSTTGRDAVDLIEGAAGVVVVALDYPMEEPRDVKGMAAVMALPRIRRALLDTPPALLLAAEWVLRQAWADPERLEVAGASLGAPFACIAGALDPRFHRVWSIHGGGRPHRMIAAGLRSRIPNRPLRALTARLAAALAHAGTLAPERWVAEIAPRELVMVNALDDEHLPRECVDALHGAAREPKELVWLPGGHVLPSRESVLQDLVQLVADRIESDGPIPPLPVQDP